MIAEHKRLYSNLQPLLAHKCMPVSNEEMDDKGGAFTGMSLGLGSLGSLCRQNVWLFFTGAVHGLSLGKALIPV